MGERDNDTRAARWRVFVLASAASGLLYLHRYAWGVIKPNIQDENPHLSATDLGFLDSAFMAVYAVCQVPTGMLGDRYGARVLLSGMILLWTGAATAVVAVTGFVPLLLVRGTLGLAQAGAYPTISRLSRDWFPPEVRTSLQGIVTAMGRIGGACAPPLIATALIGFCHLSWRGAILVLGLPGIALAVLFWFSLRSSPQAPPHDSSAAPASGGRLRALDRASAVSLAVLLVYAFASTFQDQLFVYWLPLFLVKGRGFDETQMGVYAPLPLVGAAIGGVVGGILNDLLIRRVGKRWARSGVGCAGKMSAGLLIATSVLMDDGRVAMLVLFAARFFSDWSLASQWGATTDMGGRATATLFSIVNTVGAIGGAVGSPVLGWLKDHHGWEGLFFGAACMCVVAALCWLFIDCTRQVVADTPLGEPEA